MTTQAISFQKTMKPKMPPIRGTKPSIQNAQLLVSSGVPSLDFFIGGGIPVGTMLLAEEDTYRSFSNILMKYFFAEGIICGHSIIAASQDADPVKMIAELPAVVQEEEPDSLDFGFKDESMKIAWRYQNIKPGKLSSTKATNFGHNYDLSQTIDPAVIKDADICYWSAENSQDYESTNGRFRESSYDHLLELIHQCVKEGEFSVEANPKCRNILRIGVASLGSPLWGPVDDVRDICLFLYCLRAILRTSYAVCLVTLPWCLLKAIPGAIQRCEHLADYVIKLDAWEGEPIPALRDYHGLFHICKLPAINTLVPHLPDSFDLAFRLRRKKFVIQRLHLPPELQETAEREQDDMAVFSGKTLPCGKALDF